MINVLNSLWCVVHLRVIIFGLKGKILSSDYCFYSGFVQARLWMQIMRELRQGVKLKKVQTTVTHPVEYELTPYEILMDDVRYRRYTLNKVPVWT